MSVVENLKGSPSNLLRHPISTAAVILLRAESVVFAPLAQTDFVGMPLDEAVEKYRHLHGELKPGKPVNPNTPQI